MSININSVVVIDDNRNFSTGAVAAVTAAATTNLAAANVGSRVQINSGATPITITSLGTAAEGVIKFITFSQTGENTITLEHNATSLILPGGTTFTVADRDEAIFFSLGSGNWRCIAYTQAAVVPTSGTAIAPFFAFDTAN